MTTELHWQVLIDNTVKALWQCRNDLEKSPASNQDKVAIVKEVLADLGKNNV